MTSPRHSTVSHDPNVSAIQNAENTRDARYALDLKLTGYVVEVLGYIAAADASALIHVRPPPNRPRPRIVMVGNCYPADDAAASVSVDTFRNFYYSNESLGVYEPSGLVENKIYNITFLVVE